MGRIGLPELLIVFVIVLLFFGAKRLPEIGSAIGKALKEFRKAGDNGTEKKSGSSPDDSQGAS